MSSFLRSFRNSSRSSRSCPWFAASSSCGTDGFSRAVSPQQGVRRPRRRSLSTTNTPTHAAAATTSFNNNNKPPPQQRPRPHVPTLFVAATRQHVGKTSVSLALMSGLRKRFDRVGFFKPVGQKSLALHDPANAATKPCFVDKDAALFYDYFDLASQHVPLDCISPVHIPAGYTRAFLDGQISADAQRDAIQAAHAQIAAQSDLVLAEGTGHCAVGAIVDASNAQVAAWLDGAPTVLVVNGGLGRSLDELVLNQTLCQQHGVPIAGVVVNQVQHAKYEQTAAYMTKALQHRYGNDIPLLGCIPERTFLGCPALCDLERLLDGQLVSGRQYALRHYRVQNDLHLVACSLEAFLQRLRLHRAGVASEHTVLPEEEDDDDADEFINNAPPPSSPAAQHGKSLNAHRTLYVVHASRNDILLGFLMEAVQHRLVSNAEKSESDESDLDSDTTITTTSSSSTSSASTESTMIVTGCAEHPLSAQVLEIVSAIGPDAPAVLMSPHGTDETLRRMYAYTPKLHRDDPRRVATAVQHYEPYIDFDLLLQRIGITDDDTGNKPPNKNGDGGEHPPTITRSA